MRTQSVNMSNLADKRERYDRDIQMVCVILQSTINALQVTRLLDL